MGVDMGFAVLNHTTYLCRHDEPGAGCGVTSKGEAPPLPMGKKPFQLCFAPKRFLYNLLLSGYTETYFLPIAL